MNSTYEGHYLLQNFVCEWSIRKVVHILCTFVWLNFKPVQSHSCSIFMIILSNLKRIPYWRCCFFTSLSLTLYHFFSCCSKAGIHVKGLLDYLLVRYLILGINSLFLMWYIFLSYHFMQKKYPRTFEYSCTLFYSQT